MTGDKSQCQTLDSRPNHHPITMRSQRPEYLWGQETQDFHPGRQLGVTERSWTLEPNSLGATLRPITPFLCDFRKIPSLCLSLSFLIHKRDRHTVSRQKKQVVEGEERRTMRGLLCSLHPPGTRRRLLKDAKVS